MADAFPPLPPGFVLEGTAPTPADALPALPPGFVLQGAAATGSDQGSTLADYGRMAMTAGVRGLGGLADAISDPLAPLRRLISPGMERIEQSGRPHPGYAAGNAVFGATGVPEYQPTTSEGRTGLAAATGAIGGLPLGLAGALLGAGGGALGQGTQELTGSERAATAASLLPGAVLGGAGAALNAGRGRAAFRADPLLEAGVNPTIGQALGGTVNRLEEALTSVPILGDIVKTGRGRAVEDFNRGAIDMALKPIGEKLDKNTTLGRDAIAEASDKIGAAYDKLVPGLSVKADAQFTSDLTGLVGLARFMPAERQKQFTTVLQSEVLDKLSPGGGMTGPSFKEAESALGRLSSQYRNSASADERQLGGALQELRSSMRDLLYRSNPDKAEALRAVNDSYAQFLRVQGAAGRIGGEEGVFSPAQLLSSVRQLDPSLRKSSFAKGGALMQDYAEAGKTVLGNKLPDSGTATRSLAALLAGASGGSMLSPGAALGLAAGGAGIGGLYSPAGRAALAYLLGNKPAGPPLAASGLLAPASTDELRRGLLY